MFSWSVIILVLLCYLLQYKVRGARILSIIPTYSYSHQVNHRPILIELARRGHQVFSATPYPLNDTTIKNYIEIDLGQLYEPVQALDLIDVRFNLRWLDMYDLIWNHSFIGPSDKILGYGPIKKLIHAKGDEKFDLFITETLYYNSLYALAYILQCPLVGVLSLGLPHTVDHILGLPPMPSYPSNWEMGNLTGEHLPLSRRIYNFIYRAYHMYIYKTVLIKKHNEIVKKHFGDDIPDVELISKNISLLIHNYHEILQFPKLSIGKMISVGGIYTSLKTHKNVSRELQKIMDDAVEGFIYVSFGNNVLSRKFPANIKQALINVFSNLPYKILWKYEDGSLPSLSPNIYVAKWFPQHAVLGHRNIKLMVYQGGLQSTEEAIINGVPLVAMAVFADQDTVVARLVKIGIAKNIEVTQLTEKNFYEAIREVLNNKSYKENALKAQKMFKDKPYDSLEHAVWWIEYVIRNKGTPYHHYSIADDAWYSRYDEDVIAVLSIATFIISSLVLFICIRLCLFCLKNKLFEKPVDKLKSN